MTRCTFVLKVSQLVFLYLTYSVEKTNRNRQRLWTHADATATTTTTTATTKAEAITMPFISGRQQQVIIDDIRTRRPITGDDNVDSSSQPVASSEHVYIDIVSQPVAGVEPIYIDNVYQSTDSQPTDDASQTLASDSIYSDSVNNQLIDSEPASGDRMTLQASDVAAPNSITLSGKTKLQSSLKSDERQTPLHQYTPSDDSVISQHKLNDNEKDFLSNNGENSNKTSASFIENSASNLQTNHSSDMNISSPLLLSNSTNYGEHSKNYREFFDLHQPVDNDEHDTKTDNEMYSAVDEEVTEDDVIDDEEADSILQMDDDESEEVVLPVEQRLMYKLLHNYDRSVRPVRNATETVPVKMGLTLTQIFDLVIFYIIKI